MRFTLPKGPDVAWFRIARIPAKAGAPTEVPPTTFREPSAARKPFTQLPPEQIRVASWAGEALKVMSGTSRFVSAGVSAFCQAGFANLELTPPPVAESPAALVSFHVVSGMYICAELIWSMPPLVPNQ